MLWAPSPPNSPRNRYVTSCRSTLRSNGSDAMVVETVASSRPVRRITARHGGSHSRTSASTVVRSDMKRIITR